MDDGLSWKDVALWLGGLLVAGLQLVGLWQVKRIGALEVGKADKSDLKALIDEIRAERESAKESRGRLYERVNTMAESLARLEGRIGGG